MVCEPDGLGGGGVVQEATDLEDDGFFALHDGRDYRFPAARDEVAVTSSANFWPGVGACRVDSGWAAVVGPGSERGAGGHV